MLLLAFDTAGPNCAVALAQFEASRREIVYRMEERIARGHAERLIPMIDAALASAGLSYANIDRIAVTTGPGSFTGVRVGIAAARALALALGIPAVGIGTLSALAFGALDRLEHGTVVAVLDARRGEVYALAQDAASGTVVLDPVAAPAEKIALELRGVAGPFRLAGAGAPLLAPYLGGLAFSIVADAETPDISDVASLAARAETGIPPVPLYLRGADAKPQTGKAVARL